MHNARPQRVVRIVALLLLALAAAFEGRALAFDDPAKTEAGATISNRAEATYIDDAGTPFGTVSETITLTVRAVSSVIVTPDESEPSNTVSPNERLTRLFRVCNAGNTPDFYTITRAEVSAPAALVALYFDTDASSTVTDGDRLVRTGEGMSPRLVRGACVGLLAVVDSGASPAGTRLTIGVTARSNVLDAAGGAASDDGTIINTVGNGALFTSPADPRLPPVKLVENRERLTTAFGQVLNYRIEFRNSGDVTARRAVLRDELPAGLEYVPGSMRLNGQNLSDAEDGDAGQFVNGRIEVRWSEVAIDELVQVTFQARVGAGVQPGAGLVNTASVSADNTPLTKSSSTVVVINPFGLVYEARSGGANAIGGARVTLLQDQTGGATLNLPRDTGTQPNERNDNPFISDGQGRWSFALAPEQLGTTGASARYFLNVTAPGYRSRMIEVNVMPATSLNGANGAGGLFSLTVRAVDGQPIARAGSFELTEETVLLDNLAAFALNIPMFENQAIEISKFADRPTAEIGDVVTYRVELHNSTAITLNDVEIRDTLPASFHYAAGTARVETPPDAPHAIEPDEMGGQLLFRVGQVRAGVRATITYRVRVGANAAEGEQVNTATAVGTFLSGERATTPPAHASVRVRRGLFSMQQIILGRVFEDANGNGQFDSGEQAMPGVRLYLNNGQSVITDSAGQYSFPSVNDGALVISLDPVTLPSGYSLVENGTRDSRSWTRLLRTPLGGGGLLRQNFALRAPASDTSANGRNGKSADGNGVQPSANRVAATGNAISPRGNGAPSNANSVSPNENGVASSANRTPSSGNGVSSSGDGILASALDVPNGGKMMLASAQDGREAVARKSAGEPSMASGTYEVEATETLAPVAPGAVRIVSPAPDEVVANAALEIEARVAEGWTVALEVEGARIGDSKIGMRRADHKNQVTTYSFVGINLRPGPNRIKASAVSPTGVVGETVELTAYGRGPAKRLEVSAERSELSAGGRDSTLLHVRAFDEWGHPAADTAVAVEVSAGRLMSDTDNKLDAKPDAKRVLGDAKMPTLKNGEGEGASVAGEQIAGETRQQIVQLAGGEGVVQLVADNQIGAARIRATTGTIEAQAQVQITAEVRPSILVGLAEVSIGKAAPEMSLRGDDDSWRSHIGLFYRGRLFGDNLLTLAYDSARPLNRNGANDRLFQLDPLERAYPLFGDSSTRYEDAQSNSKLYARIDRGRSYAMFGDFETEHSGLALAGYARKLTGVKVHAENSAGDFVSVTGARPDTSFARDVFPGGGLALAQLSHADILPGSEVVVIEVRDRRNPERIISREPLIRSVDYNLDAANGEIFFLRPITAFDYALNLVQIVATYEHRAQGMSSAVYTARAVKTFKDAGLRLGLSVVDQQQTDFGSFVLGGIDGEKKMPHGGTLAFEYATSRGQAAFSGNLFGADAGAGGKRNGNAYSVELDQPLGYKESRLHAGYARADEGFLNPFGSTITPGSQRTHVGIDTKVRASSIVGFEFIDERNRTANVSNRRRTGSLNWSEKWSDRFRTTFGYDFRRLTDDRSGRVTNSNLVSVGAEYQATDKLQFAIKREQNLGEADPTYPNQTTLSATYQWNQFTRLFLTQRLASAPIVPISDAGLTGFASTGSRRETAIGVETRLGRYTSVASRYQIENGINGTDSFAIIGLNNRLPVGEKLSLDLGYERGFHLAGAGESFNSATLGFSWQPSENFRTNGRYELRDRLGFGSVASLGAAGRLGDGITALARWQSSRSSYLGRHNSATNAMAALAWRPLESDRAGLLFSYTHRDLFQDGDPTRGGTLNDRSDLLSTDAYLQATRELELYGRFAVKFGDAGTPELARVSTLTYLAQGRAVYRLGKYLDAAGEMRLLAQPSSLTRRTSYGAELGFWVLSDLRLGGGYNFTGASEPHGGLVNNTRRGFYFTISSKLSNLFDLFGTSNDNLQATGDNNKTVHQQASPPPAQSEKP